MPLYRLDKTGTPQRNGSIPVYTEWMGGPSLAAVRNCPIHGVPGIRRAARITGEPDTFFSVPAQVSIGGFTVRGYITGAGIGENGEDMGYEFRVTHNNNPRFCSPIVRK